MIRVKLSALSKGFLRDREAKTAFKFTRVLFARSAISPQMNWALHDISLEILRGERIGLIGDNGAGKSTLLKLIAGILRQTTGRIEVHGKVSLLSGFGTGMIDDLTVRENIVLYGVIQGLTRRTMRDNTDEILSWAQLQEFAESPLRTLSTGMRTRLGFSISRYIESDIALFDEALSAGDRRFRLKCDEIFERYKGTDRTFLVATHNMSFVRRFCSKVLWLESGRIEGFGDVSTILSGYDGTNESV